MPAPLNANVLRLSTPALPATRPLREKMPLTLAVACANVYGGCNAMARRDAFVQPNQFDPVSDPEGDASEEVQTLQLQQDVSEWLVCLNMLPPAFVCMCYYSYYHVANPSSCKR